jgi:RNA polymerase sigma factor (sigma-70 family)
MPKSGRKTRERPESDIPPPSGRRMQLTPDELVRSCLGHDEGAWAEFLRRYGNLIYSTILKVDLPEHEKEEAFQNTVEAIYLHLPRLRDSTRLIAWIVGIARRQAINCIRGRTRAEALRDAQGVELEAAEAGDRVRVDEDRILLEQAQWAQEAMAALPESCRRLLRLMFYEDPPLGYEEIARRRGIPVGSLGPTRIRCLARMREFLRARGWEP